jgi:hypothetical protein
MYMGFGFRVKVGHHDVWDGIPPTLDLQDKTLSHAFPGSM